MQAIKVVVVGGFVGDQQICAPRMGLPKDGGGGDAAQRHFLHLLSRVPCLAGIHGVLDPLSRQGKEPLHQLLCVHV